MQALIAYFQKKSVLRTACTRYMKESPVVLTSIFFFSELKYEKLK